VSELRRQAAKSRLGWLGPAIVALGAAVAAVGVWYVLHARPTAGEVIDTIAIDARHRVVVRGETTGDRSFVELYDGDELMWQALVPAYGGRPGAPGIAVGKSAVSIRIVRDGKAEIFAIARDTAQKLGGMGLGHGHGTIDPTATGPVTLTDHIRSYEVVSGRDWHQLVAIELDSGKPLWSVELGAAPVTAGGVDGSAVWVSQGGAPRRFDVMTGKPL
jgi:outer membrane protein assembly factor BamB